MDLMCKHTDLMCTDSVLTSDNVLKHCLDSLNMETHCPSEAGVLLKNAPPKPKPVSSNQYTKGIQEDSEGLDVEDSTVSEDDRMSLKSNLRLRVLRQVPISPHRFPPYDKYHYIEKKAFRTYTNKDITIHFEILRPIECQKKFEELLLPKPESKFLIKIWIHDPKMLHKYLKYITEDGEYKEINFL